MLSKRLSFHFVTFSYFVSLIEKTGSVVNKLFFIYHRYSLLRAAHVSRMKAYALFILKVSV